jgi:hypothetical protein
VQTSEVIFNCSFSDFSISEEVTMGKKHETKSDLILMLLAETMRSKELSPIREVLWFLVYIERVPGISIAE